MRTDGTPIRRVSPLRLTNPGSPDTRSPAREFLAHKPAGTFRVFVVGGSSAAGFPYPPEYAFAAWVERELQARRPDLSVEVVNAAVAGYGTRRVLLVVRELGAYEPDLVIVYSGHNEWAERRYYSRLIDMDPRLFSLREQIVETRLFTLLSRLVGRQQEDPEAAVRALVADRDREFREMFAVLSERSEGGGYPSAEDLRQRDLVYRENLEAIVRASRAAGARVLLLGVAQNFSDWSPGASSHRSDLGDAERAAWKAAVADGDARAAAKDCAAALVDWSRALGIDEAHAGLHYRKARCHQGLGELEAARHHFALASDLDRVPHGAPAKLNAVARDVARREGATFVDLVSVLARASGPRLMGDDLFVDWAHPNLRAHQLIAGALVTALRNAGIPGPIEAWRDTDWIAPSPASLYARDPSLQRREHESRIFLCVIAHRPDCVETEEQALRALQLKHRDARSARP
jgi:lysophospholipase L1-like esterase